MTVYIQTVAGGALFPTPPAGRTTAATFVTVDAPSTLTPIVNGDSWLQRTPSTGPPNPPPPVGGGGYGTGAYGSDPYGV